LPRFRAAPEAAGFRLADEGNFLRNPGDPRDKNTPNPPQPKDEFVLKFVKSSRWRLLARLAPRAL
jgi:predicted methyltransferase